MYDHDTISENQRQEVSQKKIRDVLEIVQEKRISSLKAARYFKSLAETTHLLSEDAWLYVEHCGDALTMLENDNGDSKRLKSAFFCHQRLCPGCSYRGSLATAVVLSAISAKMLEDGHTALMVTVTAPNCTGDKLEQEIRRYNKAWNDLMKHEPYTTGWKNHIRKFEITYNKVEDTYHPHIHALVFVRPGYFKGNKYISHERLLTDWRRVFKDQSITQVDIRKTHGQDWQAISEISKYIAKSGDYLHSQQVFNTYYQAIKGKRITGYSGRCKELRKEYKQGGLRQYIERDLTEYVWLVIYVDHYQTGKYAEKTRKPYDSLIMGDDDIPIHAYMPPEWDDLAD